MDRSKALRVYARLKKEYPRATTALSHKNPLQLLVSTILSAQCTDERVNKVTKDLFKKYKKADDFAEAKQSVLEKEIRSTGFYKNKAKNIISAAKRISEEYKGKVPAAMEDLVTLPGVARKTANIVLFHSFGKNEGIAVDTHVKRLSGRLGFSRNADPGKIEEDLMKIFPRKDWGNVSNVLILHGRTYCMAKKANCEECPVNKLCPSAFNV